MRSVTDWLAVLMDNYKVMHYHPYILVVQVNLEIYYLFCRS